MSSTNKEIVQDKEKADDLGYNEMPYISYPFTNTRPEYLQAFSKMFGLDTPDLKKAKILEIGGSDGTNMFTFATDFPQASVLGVDVSQVEIDQGLERIKKLELKNYKLECMSIVDLDKSYGKFDYIICHGVYSWVPEFVRNAILEKCKTHLSKNGVALISYNTLPGWNMPSTVRDIMMYHSLHFDHLQDKVQQARLILDFINTSLVATKTPYSEFLSTYTQGLQSKADDYLRHEFLGENNVSFYFYEFMNDAAKHGLEYLGDTDVGKMFLGNVPDKAAKMLSQINDIVRTEQYLDFINNTQFRSSVLCHNSVTLSRNITNEVLNQFSFKCHLIPQQELTKEVILDNNCVVKFDHKDRALLSIVSLSQPSLKAAIKIFADHIQPLSITQVAKLVNRHYKIAEDIVKQDLFTITGRLIFVGCIEFFLQKPLCANKLTSKPKLSQINIQRCKDHASNTGYLCLIGKANNPVFFEHYFCHILLLMDGTRTQEELVQEVTNLVKNEVISMLHHNQPVNIEDSEILKQCAKELLQPIFGQLLQNYALVD